MSAMSDSARGERKSTNRVVTDEPSTDRTHGGVWLPGCP